MVRGTGLVDELGAELAADSPGQPALPWTAGRRDDGEFGWNLQMFADHLDAAVGDIGDHAIARQACSQLDFGDTPARAPLALASICKHIRSPALLD